VGLDSHQPIVADAMAREINVAEPALGPTFLVILGDIIYGNDKKTLYSDRFYQPEMSYLKPAPGFDGMIMAIPGNHDGEVRVAADQPSLSAYWENFCAPLGTHAPMAESLGVVMPNQPGAYWYLNAPFLDLIGLYSNSGEQFGLLGQNDNDTHQQAWLLSMLKSLAQTRAGGTRKALLLAVHHPPYARGLLATGSGHGGSPAMLAQIDQACAAAGIWPDAVLSGHSHNYQRYLRRCQPTKGNRFSISYFVVGTGGIQTQPVPTNIGHSVTETAPPGLAASSVGYQNALDTYGYLRVAASAQTLTMTFVPVASNQPATFETVTIDLASHDLQFA
jgi:predicted phosphodiesterase